MDCVTPSQPVPIPHGVSQEIEATLKHTHMGTLFADGRPMTGEVDLPDLSRKASVENATPRSIKYRDSSLDFLQAQNAASQAALARICQKAVAGISGGRLDVVPSDWDDYTIVQQISSPQQSARVPAPEAGSKWTSKAPASRKTSQAIDVPKEGLAAADPASPPPTRARGAKGSPSRSVSKKEALRQGPITSLPSRRAPSSLF